MKKHVTWHPDTIEPRETARECVCRFRTTLTRCEICKVYIHKACCMASSDPARCFSCEDLPLYEAIIDFEEASKSWFENKIKQKSRIVYVCGYLKKNGKKCANKSSGGWCKYHIDRE